MTLRNVWRALLALAAAVGLLLLVLVGLFCGGLILGLVSAATRPKTIDVVTYAAPSASAPTETRPSTTASRNAP